MTAVAADAAYYEQERLWGAVTPRERRRLLDTVALMPESESLLDVGGGDGRLVATMVRAGRAPRFAAIAERSWAALSVASSERILADASRLPFRDQAFTTVISCEVIEHLPVAAYADVLREVQRLARAHIVLTVPNNEDLARGRARCDACGCVYHRHRHLRSFDRSVLKRLFDKFELVALSEIGEWELHLPRPAVALARRFKMIPDAGGLPICPQCGWAGSPSNGEETIADAGGSGPRLRPARQAHGGLQDAIARLTVSKVLRPMQRRPWLLAVYRRSG